VLTFAVSAGNTVQIRVRARNFMGSSDFSEILTFTLQ
jgi:hypothetical protein